MKFSIAVNMQRTSPEQSMEEVAEQALEMVTYADQAGFDIIWAAEHHAIEYTIAPNPLSLLIHWAAHTRWARLGTAVLVAPYWHPIRMAGEVAMADLLTGGRLEVGIARGAFQYEFDRLAGGIPQEEGGRYLREIVPVIRKLWEGDYEHNGEIWQFPRATSVPKPVQKPHPPLWVAARDPNTFDWAVKNDLDVMATPLSKPFSEVQNLAHKLEVALQDNPGHRRPRFLVLRTTCVYEDKADWRMPVETYLENARLFEGLFRNQGAVVNGFAQPITFQEQESQGNFSPEELHENMMFGTPEKVVEKLRMYEAVGVDNFCYGANFGLPHDVAMRSLELFATEVMPHFAESAAGGVRHDATANDA